MRARRRMPRGLPRRMPARVWWRWLWPVPVLLLSLPGPRAAVPGVVTAASDSVVVPAVARTWPTGGRPAVLRGWSPPATPYGPGHRGVDLAAAPGAAVRAVAAGRVTFAGRVAGRGVVSVELPGTGTPPLRTTYEPVRASVAKGDEVAAGDPVGTVETPGAHCPAGCLHWGLRRAGTYLNPLSLLPPWLLNGPPPRLLPVLGVPPP
ncbi:peptidoglycan DD-metalloendopeptidase family protein [Streptomyces sp. NPDC023723]|uniref:peptidoglycan DD-metalloendopeptidase family protein n=1 Tax=Streptomyces sp. NPDC023723 TaxID=3154323 RepID=UPI0033CD85D9